MMNRGKNSDSIPIDLILHILSRLPSKSISRFRCVSKLWASMLCQPYFTELFFTRCSARPRLLFGVEQGGEWSFFSSPQPQNLDEKSSLVVAADFHTKLLDTSHDLFSYASGLIYFSNVRISDAKEDEDGVRVICNPSTGQYAILPKLITYRKWGGLLGFDPIGKQFKVLILNNCVNDKNVHYILTLGTEKLRWRTIQCRLGHSNWGKGICINGVLYYIANVTDAEYDLIGCFDVRSEKFKLVPLSAYCWCTWATKLINYKGKLGVITFKYDYDGGFPLDLRMWVLEDVERREWSKYVYTFRAENKVVKDDDCISVVGVTATGEIVLAMEQACKPFYVFYFNPERNTFLSVEIQGVREEEEWFNNHRVYAFVDHVEDLRFDFMKTTTSISPLEQRRKPTSTSTTSSRNYHNVRIGAHLQQDILTFESANKFNALCLLDDDEFTGFKT